MKSLIILQHNNKKINVAIAIFHLYYVDYNQHNKCV